MKYIKHSQIDKKKWDNLVSQVPKVHFYFLYDYLSTICEWDAVVVETEGEYLCAVPLPFKKKLWLKYIYQPFFCQQLGVLSKRPISQEQVSMLKTILEKKFSFGYAQWQNLEELNAVFNTQDRKNYEINVCHPFEKLKLNYNTNRKRTINKLKKNSYEIKNSKSSYELSACVDRFSELFSNTISEIKSIHYTCLKDALASIKDKATVHVKSVVYNGNIISSGLFVEYNNRIVYLLGFTEENFRKQSVQTLLFDDLIKENAGRDRIIDLEGGSNEGIGRFYASLGGVLSPYSIVKINNNHLIFRKIFE